MISNENARVLAVIKASDLTNIDNLKNMVMMASNIMREDESETPYAMKISKYVRQCCAKLTVSTLDHRYDDLYWKCMLFEAPHIFDSFMLYMERLREPKTRFYLPRRDCFIQIGLIQALQDIEDDKLDILSLSVAPGVGKTTIEEFFVAWVIGRHPLDYNLFASHSGDITRMFYDAVNDITSSDEYSWQDVFPGVTKQYENAKTEKINFGPYKPFTSLQCTSVGSKNAGKVRCNRYLLCDDLIGGIEEATNKNRLDKLWNTYAVDLRQRKKDGCKELHIATRWSVHDVIGRLQRQYEDNPRAKFIAIPDINPETNESNFDFKYGVGFSTQYFNDVANTMDEVSYKCLYKNEPIEREGMLYHEDELRRFVTLPDGKPDAIWGVCDTKDKGTDYMFLPCAYQYDNDFYIVDCICDNNSDYGIQYRRCADIILKHNMQQVEFECNNGGGRVAYDVAEIVEKEGGRCCITSQFTSKNKETKIIVNADWVKKNCLFMDKGLYQVNSDYGKMISFLLTYSVVGRNPHDDVPDGFAQLALFVQSKISSRVEVMQRMF